MKSKRIRLAVSWQVFALSMVSLLAWSPAAKAQQEQAISPKGKAIHLFNGTDLSAWHSYLVDTKEKDPRQVFTVADKMIRISGDGFGYLSADRVYKNYRLVVEFKWGERNFQSRVGLARDSGVFLHSVGPEGNSYDGNGAFKAAIECQVMEGAVGDFLLIRGADFQKRDVPVELTVKTSRRDSEGWPWWNPQGTSLTLRRTGRVNWLRKDAHWQDRLGFRGEHDLESLPGRWTRLECICSGRGIRVFVNNQLVNQVDKVFPHAGKILLQCEGSEIFFRKVELHPLPKK